MDLNKIKPNEMVNTIATPDNTTNDSFETSANESNSLIVSLLSVSNRSINVTV